ncbi:hypothetical protein O7621_28095 [Solwaraspora sp. WMMD937]|uniref:hypothetical protein n=1 Tax=Solwaraspora sp. WMMD937 TaxID=3016090 RepID=UPI00249C0846|nr:hypothetical protein [Solwaraspora sp. WMMD937]WFE21634.1 hypothetical protein O7621_28095 [Solwaraspora sp. WMMD937]
MIERAWRLPWARWRCRWGADELAKLEAAQDRADADAERLWGVRAESGWLQILLPTTAICVRAGQ